MLKFVGQCGDSVDKTIEISWKPHAEVCDIAGGVHVGNNDFDVKEQGFMYGHMSEEIEDTEPLMHSMASRLGQKLTDVCKNRHAGRDLRTGTMDKDR